MQGEGGDDGGVRHAAESLRAALDSLPGLAEHLDGAVRARVDATTGAVEAAAAGSPSAELRRSLLGTAHEIRLLGTHMTATREDTFAEVAHVLAQHADEIDALLRPADGDGGEVPVFSISPPPAPAASIVTTAQDTEVVQQRLPSKDAQKRAINQVVAQFPPKLQHLARTLLLGHSSHAVERHGHHLRREHQIARVQWLLDPAGEDSWQLDADGSVLSQRWNGQPHGVGTIGGNYTSPAAVAKPLIALLNAAGRTQAALETYLDEKAPGKTRLRIFLPPSDTGVGREDVYAVRAPGTDTLPGAGMWLDTRNSALGGRGAAPAVREHDLVTDGDRPGSLVIMIRRPKKPWRLLTSYFHDDAEHELRYWEL